MTAGAFTPANSSVYQYLCQFHRGKQNAVKAQALADRFEICLRDVNEEIHLLRKAGVLIGSSKDKPYGYYIPVTEADIRSYMDPYREELFDMLETYNIQKRAKKTYLEALKSKDLFKKETNGQLAFV